jgi:predicted GTPase
MRVQRFATLADIDASHPTIEEREEYEQPVLAGMTMFAGVDYAEILAAAEAEADVIVWDGGNNDFSFYAPALQVTVIDPLRAGDEIGYHPGEVNLRLADVVVINKVDSASPEQIAAVMAHIVEVNSDATVVRTESPVTLEPGQDLAGARVLVVEDGPTITHGGMPFGAGMVAARRAGATRIVDPRPFAVRTIADTFRKYPHIKDVLPAMGYSEEQLADLQQTIDAAECDVVVTGTPIELRRVITIAKPVRHATYELRDSGSPSLRDIVLRHASIWTGRGRPAASQRS